MTVLPPISSKHFCSRFSSPLGTIFVMIYCDILLLLQVACQVGASKAYQFEHLLIIFFSPLAQRPSTTQMCMYLAQL